MFKKVDKPFLFALVLLVLGGLVVFLSASFGLLAKNEAQYSSIAFTQIVFGLLAGGIGCLIAANINFKVWKKYSFWFFIFAVILNLIIFIPGFGIEHGGGTRWLNVGTYSFQPGEILKIASVLYFAALLSIFKEKVSTFKFGLLPLMIMIGLSCGILLLQGDTELVLPISLTAMYMVAGGRWRDLILAGLIASILVGGLVMTKPYIKQRLYTFINPASDPLGAGYQIQQSLIAVGSGQIMGRGFGQSIQKFNFLPEPVGDSIFAVAAEEFGFIGSIFIITLYLWFALSGFKIAAKTSDSFGRLIVVGIVILIFVQSFMNIGAMLGVIPLTGVPLVFVSHGGTSMLLSLFAAGIVLSVSRYKTA